MPQGETERRGPLFGESRVGPADSDLTVGAGGTPIGERIIVSGRVTDSMGRPVRHQLVEIWQANAAGRYRHGADNHDAPLDPNFTGAGRCLTDDHGQYRFVSIKPGEYPWANHQNAWRPAHIHFSVFGTNFTERLVTQMYFPGDPLLPLDPMYQSVRDRRAAELLVARFDLASTVEHWALGYVFDIVIGGRSQTPSEGPAGN
jgi:protocatechuate 3,4-dioxygenase, beta subunit